VLFGFIRPPHFFSLFLSPLPVPSWVKLKTDQWPCPASDSFAMFLPVQRVPPLVSGTCQRFFLLFFCGDGKDFPKVKPPPFFPGFRCYGFCQRFFFGSFFPLFPKWNNFLCRACLLSLAFLQANFFPKPSPLFPLASLPLGLPPFPMWLPFLLYFFQRMWLAYRPPVFFFLWMLGVLSLSLVPWWAGMVQSGDLISPVMTFVLFFEFGARQGGFAVFDLFMIALFLSFLLLSLCPFPWFLMLVAFYSFSPIL